MDALKLSHASDNKFIFSSDQTCTAKMPLILVVDDDEDNLVLMAYTLESLNCSVITAMDGETALLAARSKQPDLILLDIMLYPVDGLQILSQLKQDSRTVTIPVVAVTALAREEDKERILQAGCNDYISKPYILEEMEAMISRYLG